MTSCRVASAWCAPPLDGHQTSTAENPAHRSPSRRRQRCAGGRDRRCTGSPPSPPRSFPASGGLGAPHAPPSPPLWASAVQSSPSRRGMHPARRVRRPEGSHAARARSGTSRRSARSPSGPTASGPAPVGPSGAPSGPPTRRSPSPAGALAQAPQPPTRTDHAAATAPRHPRMPLDDVAGLSWPSGHLVVPRAGVGSGLAPARCRPQAPGPRGGRPDGVHRGPDAVRARSTGGRGGARHTTLPRAARPTGPVPRSSPYASPRAGRSAPRPRAPRARTTARPGARDLGGAEPLLVLRDHDPGHSGAVTAGRAGGESRLPKSAWVEPGLSGVGTRPGWPARAAPGIASGRSVP